MKTLVVIFTWIAAGLVAEARLPNIVYIICDDLGYGEIQCLNPERGKVLTPHVDQFAKQGVIFTDAHSGSSVCTPTRYGVLTGRYAWRTRLQSGVIGGAGKSHASLIAKDRLTVPMLLKRSGYSTAIFGKWHLGFSYVDEEGNEIKPQKAPRWTSGLPVGARVFGSPVEYGFDRYVGFHHSAQIETVIEDNRVVRELPKEQMLGFLGDKACAYITEQSKSEAPFFLYLSLNSPHTPIAPSKEWIGKSGMGNYCDFVMETDHVAGRVFQALEKNGIANNTLVIFTSDNGCSAGPAQANNLIKEYGHYPSANLRGYKSDAWEGGHRVPFIVRWPDEVAAGTVNDRPVCHTDLLATCAAITGEKIANDVGEDSVSMLPLLKNNKAPATRDSLIHHSIRGCFSIRQGKWKLVVAHGSGGWSFPKDNEARKDGLPSMQLYDMEMDLGETNNLINDCPEKAQALLALLTAQVEKGRSTPGTPLKNDVLVKVSKHGGIENE